MRSRAILALAFAISLALAATLASGSPRDVVSEEPQAATADAAEEWGGVARVPGGPAPHRVWVNDRVLRHSLLFDGDTGEMLGAVDSGLGLGSRPPYPAPGRNEVYVVETYYTRGNRGDRVDQVVVYEATTLAPEAEIEIPPRVADTNQGLAIGTVLDGERFLAVVNQSPGSSVSIVDLAERRFVQEIVTGGCSMAYAVGPRRFGMLCGNGTALLVELDEQGHELRTAESEPFFDVVTDPVGISGVRDGERWSFASFEGLLHEVDFSGDVPVASEPWPLFTDEQKADGWRVGGAQHLALHRPSKRLYSIVHQGGPGSHKEAGPEIWVWDVEKRERVATIEAPNVLVPFMRPFLQIERESFVAKALAWILPAPGVHSIAVTQDDAPLLFARNADLGAVGVMDARSGAHVGDLEEVGLSGPVLMVP